MKSIFVFTFAFYLISSSSFCQDNKKYPHRILKLADKQLIIDRSTNYEESILLADSLYISYDSSRFDIEIQQKNKYDSGLAFIMKLYDNAKTMTDEKEYCDSMIVQLKARSDRELKDHEDKRYQDILDKAEEHYANGNKTRAIELYERAVSLRPSDEQAKSRLEELKNEK